MNDKILTGLGMVAMVLPPWNIFWWVVGYVTYKAFEIDKEVTSKDGAVALLFAPVVGPYLVGIWLLKVYEKFRNAIL